MATADFSKVEISATNISNYFGFVQTYLIKPKLKEIQNDKETIKLLMSLTPKVGTLYIPLL